MRGGGREATGRGLETSPTHCVARPAGPGRALFLSPGLSVSSAGTMVGYGGQGSGRAYEPPRPKPSGWGAGSSSPPPQGFRLPSP